MAKIGDKISEQDEEEQSRISWYDFLQVIFLEQLI